MEHMIREAFVFLKYQVIQSYCKITCDLLHHISRTCILLVYKAVKQRFVQNQELCVIMETFRQMVNECIRIGLDNNISTLKKFSSNHYHDLEKYDIQSKYKLTAISQVCGRLAQMKRSIKEGKTPKSPYVQKPYLVSCYGFKINGMLLSIPVGDRSTSTLYFTIIRKQFS